MKSFDARPDRRRDKARAKAAPPQLIPNEPGPSLARIMSISGITVALVAAAAMGAEHAFNPPRTTFDVADDGTAAAPIYQDTTTVADSDASEEYRRILLLERQIAVLQDRLRESQAENARFALRVSTLEDRLSVAEVRLETKQIVERIDKDDVDQNDQQAMVSPLPMTPHGEMPAPEAESTAIPEGEIITGSIDPTGAADGASEAMDDLSRYAAADARNDESRMATQTHFALGLDLFDTIGELKDTWNALSARLGDMLDGLEARALHQGTESGVVKYRLVVGPFDNAADAAQHCAKLEVRGVDCSQTVFGGELIEAGDAPATIIRFDVVGSPSIDLPSSDSVEAIIANPPIPIVKPSRS